MQTCTPGQGVEGRDHKHLYRKIDFRGIYGRIVTIEYDPNRNEMRTFCMWC